MFKADEFFQKCRSDEGADGEEYKNCYLLEKEFMSELDSGQKEKLKKLSEAYAEITLTEAKKSFVQGMKFGASFMMEVMK